MLTILNKKMSGVGAQTLDSVSGRVIGGLALITIGIGVAYAYGTLKTEKKKASIISLVNEIQNAFPNNDFSGMTTKPAKVLVDSGALSSGTFDSKATGTLQRDGMDITIAATATSYTLSLDLKDKKLCKKMYTIPLPGLSNIKAQGDLPIINGNENNAAAAVDQTKGCDDKNPLIFTIDA